MISELEKRIKALENQLEGSKDEVISIVICKAEFKC